MPFCVSVLGGEEGVGLEVDAATDEREGGGDAVGVAEVGPVVEGFFGVDIVFGTGLGGGFGP